MSLHSFVAYQALNQPSQCRLDAALLWVLRSTLACLGLRLLLP